VKQGKIFSFKLVEECSIRRTFLHNLTELETAKTDIRNFYETILGSVLLRNMAPQPPHLPLETDPKASMQVE
jgi:hypothetical protein